MLDVIGRHIEQAQRTFHHILEYRRRNHTAGITQTGIGILQDHHHRKPRIINRHHAREERVVAAGITATVRQACSAGFAGDMIAAHRGLCRGTAGLGHRLHHFHDFVRDLRIEHLLAFAFAAFDEGRCDGAAVIAERCIGVRQLQGRHAQAVTVRHGLLGGTAPQRRRRQEAGTFTGKAAAGACAITESAHEVVEILVGQAMHDHRRTDIGTFADDAGGIEYAVIMGIGSAVFTVGNPARIGVEYRFRCDLAGLQGRRDRQWLHGRARLHHIGHRLVASGFRTHTGARIRIERRIADHGQHFTGAHIEHHRSTGFGAGVDDALFQLAVGQILDAAVDRQDQVLAVFGRADQIDVLDDTSAAIADDFLLARGSGQPFVKHLFQAFHAMLIEIGGTDQLRHDFAVRIEAAEFTAAVDAMDTEIDYRFGIIRIHVTAQIHELLVFLLRQLTGQRFQRNVQRFRQFRDALAVSHHFFGIDPDRLDRTGHCQRFAIAVGDHATGSRNRHFTQEALVTRGLQFVIRPQLHIGGTRHHHAAAQQQHADNPDQTGARLTGARGRSHGCTTVVSLSSGKCMPSFSVAMPTMRLVSDTVACSVCSRRNSTLNSSRCFCRRLRSM